MAIDPLDIDKTLKPEDAQPASSSNYTLSPGDTLGQYKIIRALGRGGMGEVYEAEHQVLRRRYALKLLPAEFAKQQGALDRFQREAQVMANLEHQNIIKVDDFGESDDRYWLRMELAEGQESGKIVSLQDLADSGDGRIEQKKLAAILKQILDALAYAHDRGAIHRDLKPSNILFSGSHAKISDFGLVRLVGEDWVRSQAQLSVQRSMSVGDMRTMQGQGNNSAQGSSTRSMLGTFEYMSPEQKRGEDATAQSDLYAVGLMAFKLLTGEDPGLKPPSRIDAGLEQGWDAFLERALEKNTGERWRSADEMLVALDNIYRGLDHAQKTTQAEIETEQRRQTENLLKQAEAQRQADEQARYMRAEREAATAPGINPADPINAKKHKRLSLFHLLWFIPVTVGVWWLTPTSRVEPAPVRTSPVREPQTTQARPPLPVPRNLTPTSSAVQTPQLGPVEGQNWTSPATGMEFVWIPAMRIWVGKFEVTNGEYRKMEPGHDSKSYQNHSLNGDRQPVVYVNFDDAKAYGEWLTQQDRAALGGARYRLPSEQEWMTYAQCGDGRKYPWGNNWPPRSGQAGNYSDLTARRVLNHAGIDNYDDGFAVTAPVDRLWRNPWGLYGVGGNVWEVCARDSSGGSFGASCGASWGDSIQYFLRCSLRNDLDGSSRNDITGFRLVLSR